MNKPEGAPDEAHILPGAIQIAVRNNEVKQRHIQRAARLLGTIIALLVALYIAVSIALS